MRRKKTMKYLVHLLLVLVGGIANVQSKQQHRFIPQQPGASLVGRSRGHATTTFVTTTRTQSTVSSSPLWPRTRDSLTSALALDRGGYQPEEDEEEDEVMDLDDDDSDDDEPLKAATQSKATNVAQVDDDAFSLISSVFADSLQAMYSLLEQGSKTLFRFWNEMESGETWARFVDSVQKLTGIQIAADDDESPPSSTTTTDNKTSSAATTSNDSAEDDSPSPLPFSRSTASHKTASKDFGPKLAKLYGISATRKTESDDDENSKPSCPINTGAFTKALAAARAQGRLLLVLIPADQPNAKNEADTTALTSFLSREVSKVANRPARKYLKTGSFYLWSALPGSSEATGALRRIKSPIAARDKKRPFVAALAPLRVVSSSTGRSGVVAKVLAQHHASPPPSAEQMATWLQEIRKRHATLYLKMQKELKEVEIATERKEGYRSSVATDTQNQKLKQQKEAEQKAKKAKEAARLEEIAERRKLLKAELPEEPSKDEANIKTIALRLEDGRSFQRRFRSDELLATVFSWADVECEMERESVCLTTGQKSFVWEKDQETTLDEAGLSKMAALRVSEQQQSEEPKEEVAAKDEATAQSSD